MDRRARSAALGGLARSAVVCVEGGVPTADVG